MKLRRIVYILIAAVIAMASVSYTSEAFAKRSKARTSQSAKSSKTKKNRKKSKSKKKTSSKGKKNSKKRKDSKSRRTKGKSGNTGRRSYTRGNSTSNVPKETPSYDSLTLRVNQALLDRIPANHNPGGLRVNSVKTDSRSKTARLSLNENFTYLPVTQEMIKQLSHAAEDALPDSLSDYRVQLNVGNRSLSYYITKIDKLPEAARRNIPFVVAAQPWCNPKHGMEGDIIAMWHSHGRYYRGSGWQWQRPMLFQTVEDIFTMTYILPYAVPMLENAGAYVLLPRERDPNPNEVIVDNDTNEDGRIYSQPYYKESKGSKAWQTGEEEGFIYDLPDFRDTENPFENGTYRQTVTVKGGTPSIAAWYADIPEDGEYAVYVSYKTLPNSTKDAHYAVNYSGGTREFRVNQQMGGSTWIYLGTFPFRAGYSDTTPLVTLTNLTEGQAGTVVTADAVKIGGGMGNIARSASRSDIYYDPSTPESDVAQNASKSVQDDEDADDEDDDEDEDGEEDEDETDETEGDEDVDGGDGQPAPAEEKEAEPVKKGKAPVFRTSGLPRFVEGARYWMQWAGVPEEVYSPYHGRDDYKDDYTDRGMWVNYLAGGSRVLPKREGLNIPVDAVMALHSDAGKRSDDSFVGTLGIYYTNGGGNYADGTPRINSRMLTDMLMRQIVSDIRQSYEPRWTRRSMWDKSYLEARVPEVPTALIELMSHQNFADMMYGLDPGFRFTVGRSIYKALGRFVSERKGREFVVQPLPASNFAVKRLKKGHYRLSWTATPDSLEPTANPSKYIILERSGDELGFHKIAETKHTYFEFRTSDHSIHSFRIVAANDGGLSFPTETLALCEGENNDKPVLIVNGFSRISGPARINSDGKAGFNSEEDFGVPYIREIGFSGYQTEFRRGAGESHGRSGSNYIGRVIAGNTFDYPFIHGEAIAISGRGFVSCSLGAVENGTVKLTDYKVVDLILGKQKATVVGNGKSGVRYTAFTPKLQSMLRAFTKGGGRLLVSGAYVGSDLYDSRQGEAGREFAAEVLGIEPVPGEKIDRAGRVYVKGNIMAGVGQIPYSSTLNDTHYIVERPDILEPAGNGETIFTSADSSQGLGILSRIGKSRVAVSSIPLESITDEEVLDKVMARLLDWLEEN
ncbi:MAG: xanthan lyase [Muribaculum sp.]|nr:xanthan lyase [Muribaculum sp.]